MKFHLIVLTIYLLLQSVLGSKIVAQDFPASNAGKPFSNPAIIYGSDFLTVFQLYYKQGNWDMLLKLTSKKSLKKFGRMKILHYYQSMQMGYQIKLISCSKFLNNYELNYIATINATSEVIRIKVSVENDTCRIILGGEMRICQ